MLAPKIVLELPMRDPTQLSAFGESCLSENVSLIAVVGIGCEEIEDEIDWLIVGDGTDKTRFAMTTSHLDETVEEAMAFARRWGDPNAPTKLVRI